ncbi:MAG: hypothetical protein ACRC46_10940 [Thermoguttaceae bacterium]
MSEKHLGISEAATVLNARPRDITNAFYNRQLRTDLCPVVSGRRIIPESYLTLIAQQLRRDGKQVNYEGIVSKGGRNE